MPSWLSGLRCCTGSSPGVASRATGHCGARASLCGLLLLRSAGSRVRRLQQLWLPASEQRLSSSCGARKLSCFSACASRTRDQTWAPASAGDSATLTPPGKPLMAVIILSFSPPRLLLTPPYWNTLHFLGLSHTTSQHFTSFPINLHQQWWVPIFSQEHQDSPKLHPWCILCLLNALSYRLY